MDQATLNRLRVQDRAELVTLLTAINGAMNSLRRDECGDWTISGSRGTVRACVRPLGASNVVTLHPHVLDNYRESVEKVHAAVTANADAEVLDPEIVAGFRNLMDSIVVQPTGYREPYVVDA